MNQQPKYLVINPLYPSLYQYNEMHYVRIKKLNENKMKQVNLLNSKMLKHKYKLVMENKVKLINI